MLEVKNATITIGGKTLAEGLSFMAKDGQITCITGEEGVGKTTLLRTLMGFQPVAEGFVSVDGELLTIDSAYMSLRGQRVRLKNMPFGICRCPMLAWKNSQSP